MAELNSLPIDLFTALPLLQLLLAIRGLEEPDMPFGETWSVFKEFAGAGDSSSDPIVTVQLQEAEAEPTDFEVFMGREVQGVRNGYDVTRLVGVQFLLRGPSVGPVQDRELWSTEFQDLAAFVAAVEASPGFRVALASDQMACTFRLEEETDEFGVV